MSVPNFAIQSFSLVNIERIYMGEPAYAESKLPDEEVLPVNALSKAEYGVCEIAATGESYQTIAEKKGITDYTVRTHLYNAYSNLGIIGKIALPAFFPVKDDTEQMDCQDLSKLTYRQLDILQAVTMGIPYKQIARLCGLSSPSSIRSHIFEINARWQVNGVNRAQLIANRLRAQKTQEMLRDPRRKRLFDDLANLTLPNLVRLERQVG